MSARAALLALSAALLVALAPAGPGSAASARDGAPDCAWHHHEKRTVKHIRRHGKVLKVVRTRRWWSCDPLPPPPPPVGPARLGVKAVEYSPTEFGYILSRPSVAAGDVIVELDNRGGDPHNLNIAEVGSSDPALHIDDTDPSTRMSANFNLAAGTYKLWCSLPQHEGYGMQATLIVSQP